MSSAYYNLVRITEKVEDLEILYSHMKSYIKSNDQLNDTVVDDELLRFDNYLMTITLETILYIMQLYLKFLSGKSLSLDESTYFREKIKRFNCSSPTPIFFITYVKPVSMGEYTIFMEEITTLYINLLKNFIRTHNLEIEFTGIVDHSASKNLSHIADRIHLMETLYIEARVLCPKVRYVNGYGSVDTVVLNKMKDAKLSFTLPTNLQPILRTIECDELLNVMDTYLKILSGQNIPSQEYMMYLMYSGAGVKLIYGLSDFGDFDICKLSFDTYVEPYITWLQNIVNQCHNYNEVMNIINTKFHLSLLPVQ